MVHNYLLIRQGSVGKRPYRDEILEQGSRDKVGVSD